MDMLNTYETEAEEKASWLRCQQEMKVARLAEEAKDLRTLRILIIPFIILLIVVTIVLFTYLTPFWIVVLFGYWSITSRLDSIKRPL